MTSHSPSETRLARPSTPPTSPNVAEYVGPDGVNLWGGGTEDCGGKLWELTKAQKAEIVVKILNPHQEQSEFPGVSLAHK